MTGFIVLAVIIVAGLYLRLKFDFKYAMPVLKENKNLSYIYIFSLVMLAAALVSYFRGFRNLTFILLLSLIPFVLYLNFKTYWGAWSKFVNRKQDGE